MYLFKVKVRVWDRHSKRHNFLHFLHNSNALICKVLFVSSIIDERNLNLQCCYCVPHNHVMTFNHKFFDVIVKGLYQCEVGKYIFSQSSVSSWMINLGILVTFDA